MERKLKLTACIIAKNEAEIIENCLKSIENVVDEIIILDTGSTDKTKEIASGYSKVKIFETEWQDDFSKARNECISFASGNWILVIDADEALTKKTQVRLIPFLKMLENPSFWKKQIPENTPEEMSPLNRGIIISLLINEYNEKEQLINKYYKGAIFRNDYGIHYFKPIHESLEKGNYPIINLNTDTLEIDDLKYLNKYGNDVEKQKYYIRLLLKAIDEDQNNIKNYYYYHLGRSYSQIGKHDEALQAFEESFKMIKINVSDKNINVTKAVLLDLISELILYHKKYIEALNYLEILFKLTNDLPDAFYYRGICHSRLGNHKSAINSFLSGLSLLENKKSSLLGISSLFLELSLNFRIELSQSYLFEKQYKIALDYITSASNISRENIKVLFSYFRYYFMLEDFEKANYYYPKCNNIFTKTEKEKIAAFLSDKNYFIQFNSIIEILSNAN